jgi:hypothetical protein
MREIVDRERQADGAAALTRWSSARSSLQEKPDGSGSGVCLRREGFERLLRAVRGRVGAVRQRAR